MRGSSLDVIITDWDMEAGQDDKPQLDQALMNLKRHLGASAVALTAAQLLINVSPETCRADFSKPSAPPAGRTSDRSSSPSP